MRDYTIYADNRLIYNPRIVGDEGEQLYNVIEPTLSESTENFSALTFTAREGSPAFDYCTELVPRIKVYRGSKLYWTGRVLSVSPDINDQREYYVEDFLGVLCDTVFPPYNFGGTCAAFLQMIVDSHNTRANENQRFVSVVCDIDETIYRSSIDYDTSWGVIKSKLIDEIGGYIWASYDANGRAILHYSKNARDTATQPIELGENLARFALKRDYATFYTACVPLGAQAGNGEERLTIASVNGGVPYLIDQDNANIYGVRFAPPEETTWDDVTLPQNLLSRGQRWIREQASRGIEEINLSAVDLAAIDANAEEYQWLDAVPVNVGTFTGSFIIKDLVRRLDKPAVTDISMGDARSTVTGTTLSRLNSAINRIQVIESDYTTSGDVENILQPELDTLREETLTQMTAIRQEANRIIMQAIEDYRAEDAATLDSLYQRISSELAILADRIELNFESTQQSITDVDGALHSEINSIYSFIRLLPTTQTQEGGIVIGESTSEIKLKLENDVLYFFTGNETTVSKDNAIAYFAAGQLVVNEAVLRVVSIGIPGAMMHFSVVGSGSLQCLFLSPRRIDD